MQHSDLPDTFPPGRHIVLALAALVLLTGASYGVSFVELGALNTPIAIAIAALKAIIVAVGFMELMRASTPARIVVLVTIAFIAILSAGAVGDVAFR